MSNNTLLRSIRVSRSKAASLPSHSEVLHIIPALFDSQDGILGGAERYALELARHMANETPTTLVTFGGRERQETVGQLKIKVIGNAWYVRRDRFNPLALSLVSELRKADVIHCHQQHILVSSVAALIGKFSRRRDFVRDLINGVWDVSGYVSTG